MQYILVKSFYRDQMIINPRLKSWVIRRVGFGTMRLELVLFWSYTVNQSPKPYLPIKAVLVPSYCKN